MIAVKNAVDPLSPLLREALSSAQSFVPLKSLRYGFLEDLFCHVQPQSVLAGQKVFEMDSVDHQYIYLRSGALSLTYASGKVEQIYAGESLLPIANQQPRICKAVASEDSVVLRIDSDRLDRALSWSQMTDYLLSEFAMDRRFDGDLEWIQTILASNLFFKVPSMNAEHILSRLVAEEVTEGQVIIQQGDIGDCCYFLKQGEAQVLREEDGEAKLVAEIHPGRCFGEDALVEDRERNASVVMKTAGQLMRLDKQGFALLLDEPVVEEVDMRDIDALDERFAPIFIDLRTDAEYALGHLAYSANMPLSVMAMKKRQLAPEKPYLFYCDSGRRSKAAAFFLGKEGYNVVSLRGGLQGQDLMEHLVVEAGYILRDGALLPSARFD